MALLFDRGSCDYGRNSALAHRLLQDFDLNHDGSGFNWGQLSGYFKEIEGCSCEE
jgi:hypothetical protein